MSKYTPGPWKCGQYLGHSFWVVHTDVGDRGRGMDIVEGVAGLTPEQRLANARLIAAAPDLLLELDNCLDLLVTCFPDSPDNSRIGVAVTKARAAIAKATGETK